MRLGFECFKLLALQSVRRLVCFPTYYIQLTVNFRSFSSYDADTTSLFLLLSPWETDLPKTWLIFEILWKLVKSVIFRIKSFVLVVSRLSKIYICYSHAIAIIHFTAYEAVKYKTNACSALSGITPILRYITTTITTTKVHWIHNLLEILTSFFDELWPWIQRSHTEYYFYMNHNIKVQLIRANHCNLHHFNFVRHISKIELVLALTVSNTQIKERNLNTNPQLLFIF